MKLEALRAQIQVEGGSLTRRQSLLLLDVAIAAAKEVRVLEEAESIARVNGAGKLHIPVELEELMDAVGALEASI